jgi:hypothetical protein
MGVDSLILRELRVSPFDKPGSEHHFSSSTGDGKNYNHTICRRPVTACCHNCFDCWLVRPVDYGAMSKWERLYSNTYGADPLVRVRPPGQTVAGVAATGGPGVRPGDGPRPSAVHFPTQKVAKMRLRMSSAAGWRR